MMKIKFFAVLGTLVLAASCTPTKVVVPFEEGQWQIGVTQGRPQINEGYLPVIGAYAAKGVSAAKTNYGGIQFSSLAFRRGPVRRRPSSHLDSATRDLSLAFRGAMEVKPS